MRDSDTEREESVGSWRGWDGDSKACVCHRCRMLAFFLRCAVEDATIGAFLAAACACLGWALRESG